MTYDPKTKTWEWRQGYDYATEKYKDEIDRLRAENASLKAELDWHVDEIKRIKAGE